MKDRNICLQLDASHSVKIAIDDIKLIGEYTTDRGPFEDDWYLCMYYGKDSYFEFSMYTNNIQTMISNLAEALNSDFFTTLHSSTDWHSNILYPPYLNGQVLWYRTRNRPTSLGRILKALFGLYEYDLVLTEEAEAVVNNYIGKN